MKATELFEVSMTIRTSSVGLTSLGSQPVVPQTLSGEKQDNLRHELAYLASLSHVRDAAGWQSLLPNFAVLTQALAAILDPRPENPLVQALATATRIAPPDAALQSVQSVLLNRRDDLVASLALLQDRAFTDSAWRLLERQRFQIPGELGPLPAPKWQELMETLVQPRHGRLEPAAHIHATAAGHVQAHVGLAHAFTPGGPAAALLHNLLSQAALNVPSTLTQSYVNRWLEIRHTRAQQVADAYLPDSPLVQSAIRLSEENRLSRSAAPAVSSSYAKEKPEEKPQTTISGFMEHFRYAMQPLLQLTRLSR